MAVTIANIQGGTETLSATYLNSSVQSFTVIKDSGADVTRHFTSDHGATGNSTIFATGAFIQGFSFTGTPTLANQYMWFPLRDTALAEAVVTTITAGSTGTQAGSAVNPVTAANEVQLFNFTGGIMGK